MDKKSLKVKIFLNLFGTYYKKLHYVCLKHTTKEEFINNYSNTQLFVFVIPNINMMVSNMIITGLSEGIRAMLN